MENLKMHSPDFTEQNISRLAELFPNCVTEAEGDDGRLKKAVDFDRLRQELSGVIIEGQRERFHLDWPGKKEAILAANAPIAKTLRPCQDESVDFEATKNIFIEGDNLDALKLLQETYLNKVKMIYIDPPYNTGKEFVYGDDFSQDANTYFTKSNQRDDAGSRMILNTEANGRFHSDWLSMMYPRLRLARTLLRDDGMIFISIDDNELHNLRKICDEIFGEGNFCSTFIWEKRTNRENRQMVSSRHDYVVAYFRDVALKEISLCKLPMSEAALNRYSNPDDDPRGPWKSDPATAQAGHATPSQFYAFVGPDGREHHPPSGRCWLFTKEVFKQKNRDGMIWFGKNGTGVPRVKTYLNSKERGLTPESMWFAKEASTNESAKTYLKTLFNGKAVFDTPKPVELLEMALKIGAGDGIVMDFFAGSSPTAEAVFRLGRGNRFILIQMPEECAVDSEAYKAGYRTIADVGKDRIRLAGVKVKEDAPLTFQSLDTGFRVLKVETSNMKDVHYAPGGLKQGDLPGQVGNIKEGRTHQDLLFQVLLDWGVDLSLPISEETIEDKTVFFVDGNALAACFDQDITEGLVNALAARKPLRAVFCDSGYGNDSVKINVTQIFKLISPSTEVKSI
jgi:adenine-specific DNA-methyltransferase